MSIEETIEALRNQFAIMEDARAGIPRNASVCDPAHSKWSSEMTTLEVMLRQAWPKIDAALAERERLRAACELLVLIDANGIGHAIDIMPAVEAAKEALGAKP